MNKNILLIDGQNLDLNRCGGAGRYGRQLYERLVDPVKSQQLADYQIFLHNFPDTGTSECRAAGFSVKRSVDMLKHAIARCCPPVLFDRLLQLTDNRKRNTVPDAGTPVPVWSELTSLTILHELTNYFLMNEIGRLSLSSKVKLAVTFLDLQDYYYPDYFNDEVLCSRRLAYSFYKDRADIFFAISEFTKQSMIEHLKIDAEKILVTHLAADDLLVLDPSEEIINWVKSFGKFWIYPAKALKHKNHDFLFRALGKRREELKKAGVTLLLTGGFNKADNNRLETLITDNGLCNIVKILGFVSDEHLQALLREADYLVFPSLFEGFGMPILEAMTFGCPVLSSNAGSLPEVGGDAALYFDPESEGEFIALIDFVIENRGIDREDMIRKGYGNCKRFSWDKTYFETIEAYKRLLG